MHKKRNNNRPALFAGILAAALSANATVQNLATPSPCDYADTESATNVPLVAWRAFVPQVRLTLGLNATPTNAVQVAFGFDRNGDADLAPEETEFTLGCDCSSWFIRDELTGTTDVSPVDGLAPTGTTGILPVDGSNAGARVFQPVQVNAGSSNRVSCVFGLLLAKNPANRWDLAKITTRGSVDSAAVVAAELRKPHFYIVVR